MKQLISGPLIRERFLGTMRNPGDSDSQGRNFPSVIPSPPPPHPPQVLCGGFMSMCSKRQKGVQEYLDGEGGWRFLGGG